MSWEGEGGEEVSRREATTGLMNVEISSVFSVSSKSIEDGASPNISLRDREVLRQRSVTRGGVLAS